MLFQNITGKKETRGFHEEVVIACPTVGEFRITPKVQAKLELEDGDFGLVVVDPENPSNVYLAKGIKGENALDENGKKIRDKRKRYVYVDNTGFGAVLRTASEGSPNLKLSAASAWNALGGDNDFNKYFTLGEPVEGKVPTTLLDEDGEPVLHETVFYQLIFQKAKPKSKRGSGEDDDDDDDDDSVVENNLAEAPMDSQEVGEEGQEEEI